ncbi:MAG: hypothetical protein ABW217_14935 [Polyangiaceae bacterium]
MTSKTLSALGLLLIIGCSSESPAPESAQRIASSAIQALTAKDEEALAQCGRAVDNCRQNSPDAAPADACDRLVQHCDELRANLTEVREPAIGCWRRIEESERDGSESLGAAVDTELAKCHELERGAGEDRDPVVRCAERIEQCLERASSLPEAAAVSCENISEMCRRAAKSAVEAAHARGQGKSDEAKELNEHARKAEQESEDASETERSGVDATSDIPSVADEHARDDNARQEPRRRR